MAILLLARCGMRISEPLRLKPDHYSSNEGTIYIEKTKFSKDRLIPAPKTVISEMDNYLAVRKAFIQGQTPYLLPGQNSHTLSTKRIYKAFGRAVKDIGIDQPRRTIANTTFGNPTTQLEALFCHKYSEKNQTTGQIAPECIADTGGISGTSQISIYCRLS